jgi:transposase
LKLFLLDIEATKVSKIVNISRQCINRLYKYIREIIATDCEKNAILELGEIELDESYFGGKRKGKRGRGARGKVPVFGMLKRGDNVYTHIVNNCSISELLPIIEDLADKNSVVYTDCFPVYNGLVDYGYKQHYRIKHSEQFADGRNHINGIENFWGLCKVRLSKFRGINRKAFYLHLKECEFRYNNRKKTHKELYLYMLKLIRNYNKKLKL